MSRTRRTLRQWQAERLMAIETELAGLRRGLRTWAHLAEEVPTHCAQCGQPRGGLTLWGLNWLCRVCLAMAQNDAIYRSRLRSA